MIQPTGEHTELELHERRTAFGYAVMGPILAGMLRQLYTHLHTSARGQVPVVFFCARGGLVLRRVFQTFLSSVGLELEAEAQDFMVSRLTAFRAAFQIDPAAAAPLIEIEFSGRTCAQAIRALANLETDGDARWNAPFSVARFVELTTSTELGRRVLAKNDEQADLLRRHIDELRGARKSIMLCDTGVFGSILRYLQIGVPAVDWQMTLLFRANYKRISVPHFQSTRGVVSESDVYLPWKPVTVGLHYWQLIEAMLEPPLPTVRYYRTDASGRVVSDLELAGWQDRLRPAPGSMLDGACRYLRELTPDSIPAISSREQAAWVQLRRMVIFPTKEDVALLAVGRRNFDFGVDETVEFTSRLDKVGRSTREKLALARASLWQEGELRKQFPRTAGIFLIRSEFVRLIRAATAALLQ